MHKHWLQFLLGIKWPQEKLKTMLMQNFGVINKEHYGMIWYFLEWSIKQAKTGLFIQNLCETEHPGDYERAGIFILDSRRDLGARLYEMAPVRIGLSCSKGEYRYPLNKSLSSEKHN